MKSSYNRCGQWHMAQRCTGNTVLYIHGNKGYANAPQWHVTHTLPILFELKVWSILNCAFWWKYLPSPVSNSVQPTTKFKIQHLAYELFEIEIPGHYFLKSYLLTYLLTYSMVQSPSWEANRFSSSQEIPLILWNPKVHYRIHKCPLPVPILSQIDPVHTPNPTSWISTLILSSHLPLVLPSGLLLSRLPTKTLYRPPFSTIYIVSYLLTPGSTVLLEKLTGSQLIKKFPAFYGTQRSITAFTSARHLSLSWASSIQSILPTSHFLKIYLNIILPSTPGSPQWSLSLRFPHQNPVHASPLTHTRYMPRPPHSSWFYHPHNIGRTVQIIKFLIT